jgi:hypothetical protein
MPLMRAYLHEAGSGVHALVTLGQRRDCSRRRPVAPAGRHRRLLAPRQQPPPSRRRSRRQAPVGDVRANKPMAGQVHATDGGSRWLRPHADAGAHRITASIEEVASHVKTREHRITNPERRKSGALRHGPHARSAARRAFSFKLSVTDGDVVVEILTITQSRSGATGLVCCDSVYSPRGLRFSSQPSGADHADDTLSAA